MRTRRVSTLVTPIQLAQRSQLCLMFDSASEPTLLPLSRGSVP
jgi:hypothetical protein